MTHKRALMLSSVMMRGFGVSVVADELAKRLPNYGWELFIGTVRADGNFTNTPTFLVNPDAQEILSFCAEWNIQVVVAQTTPYFEVLPHLVGHVPVIAYEHGDPTPSFFTGDGAERERIRRYKIENVYPRVDRVLASSHFLVQDIEWPEAKVVTLGCDHVPDLGLKAPSALKSDEPRSVKVGTLMRLGAGEAQYKGNEVFRALVRQLHSRQTEVDLSIMGRGTDSDANEWREIGVEPLLNATDEERANYLRGLDVFVSPSLWEGFNLPIVEAQALGTVGIGFDVGAHPETALHLASSVEDAAVMINHWSQHQKHLELASERAYRYVRKQFSWNETARLMVDHFEEINRDKSEDQNRRNTDLGSNQATDAGNATPGGNFSRGRALFRREGVWGGLKVAKRKIMAKMS